MLLRRRSGRLLGFAGLFAAVAALALVWVITVSGVSAATRRTQDQRLDDRAGMVASFASAASMWFADGSAEARRLADEVARTSPATAVTSFLAGPHPFATDVLVLDRNAQVVAASPSWTGLVGRAVEPCRRADESGLVVTDQTVTRLRDATATGAGVVTSALFDGPGRCQPTVAVAARAGQGFALIVGDVRDVEARLVAAAQAKGMRAFLVDPCAEAIEPGQPITKAAPRIVTLAEVAHRTGTRTLRYEPDESSGDELLGAYHAVATAPVAAACQVEIDDGWAVVVEQDADAFDVPATSSPAFVVAGALSAVFAVVVSLLVIFELRRRRAHRRAEAAKHVFFSIVSHELRTPLTVIKGYTDMLTSDRPGFGAEQRQELVERMHPHVFRLGRTVERVLLAANLESGLGLPAQAEPMDPLPVIERVTGEFAPAAPLHRFTVDADPAARRVLGDQAALEQIVGHLVDNAVKYSPAGGEVRVTVRRRGRRKVEIAVEDEGVGLPTGDLTVLFDAFVQGEEIDRRVHDEGGVGVGLFIVSTLTRSLGGSTRAERRPEGGARFVVTLRRVGTAKSASEPVDSALSTVETTRTG